MPRRSTTKTRHNPEDITTIRGYPDALKLFRMPASRYWYVRMYMRGRGLVKKSTQCEKLADAKHFAITWYEDLLLEKRGYQAIGAESFSVFASKLQDTQARQIKRGELSEDMLDADKMRLDKDLFPHFAGTHISKIDYNAVDAFLDDLKDERNLSQSTLKKYVVTMRKVLKEAERDGAINYIPALPTVKRNDTPRPWFSPKEYQMVLDACRELRDNPPPKYQFDFGELYDFIIFMIHTFLRPSEWKMLQNKHIRFLEQDGIEQLVRDARIAPIYEGTNGIQALDLVGRKMPMHTGRLLKSFFHLIKEYIAKNSFNYHLSEFMPLLIKSFGRLQQVTAFIASKGLSDPDEAAGPATDYLRMFALVAIGYVWTRYAEISFNKLNDDPEDFYKGKIESGKFYINKLLPETGFLMSSIMSGAKSYNDYDDSYFDSAFKL